MQLKMITKTKQKENKKKTKKKQKDNKKKTKKEGGEVTNDKVTIFVL